MGKYPRLDQSSGPSAKVGWDERRACAEKPTWWWFALPITRLLGDPDQQDTSAWKGGDDAAARREGHASALRICSGCPLALRCVRSAWDLEEYGVYGGVSEVERFYLGGRGRAVSQPRTWARYQAALNKVAARFGGHDHPIVKWIAAQPLPVGVVRPEPGAAVVVDLVIDELEEGAA